MKAAFAGWLKGMNVNVAAILIAVLTLAVSLLGFGLMVRAEMSAFRSEIRAEMSTFKAEVHSDLEDMRADNAEMRADIKELDDKLDRIASVLDTRLDDIEREQARMQGVISVLQEAVAVVPRQPADR